MAESDQFENWLTTQLQTNDYLDDDGFTDRVMCALPDRHIEKSSFAWIQFAAVFIGCLIVAWKVPLLGLFFDLLATTNLPLIVTACGAAIVATMGMIFYSVKKRLI